MKLFFSTLASFHILISLLILTAFLIPDTLSYSKLDEVYKNGGCSFRECPQSFQEEIYKEMGTLPPEYFERHTKEWWNSFCSYSPEICL